MTPHEKEKLFDDLLAMAFAAVIVSIGICLTVAAVCWSFQIPFHPRHLPGIVAAAMMVKWMYFNRR